MLRGHAREAIARCEEALAVARAVGARAEQGHALNTLGACRSGLGEHEAGEACLREALAIALELELFDDIGRAYVNLSDCIDQAGRIDEAARLALDGFEASRSLGLGTGYRAMLLSEAAHRTFRAGRWDDAERLADRALALRAGGLVEGSAHATLAQIAAARGDPAAARDGLARARGAQDRRVRDVDRAGRRGRRRARALGRTTDRGAGRGRARPGAKRGPGVSRSSPRACTGSVCARRPSSRRRRARSPTSSLSARRGLGPRIWPSGSPGRSPRRRPARPRPSCSSTRRCARPSSRASPTRPTRPRGTRRSRAPTRSASRPSAPTPAGAVPRRRSRSGSATRPPNRCAPPRPQRPGSAPGRCWRRSARWRDAAASSSATPRTRPPRTTSTSRPASATSCASSPPAAPTARSAPSCT